MSDIRNSIQDGVMAAVLTPLNEALKEAIARLTDDATWLRLRWPLKPLAQAEADAFWSAFQNTRSAPATASRRKQL